LRLSATTRSFLSVVFALFAASALKTLALKLLPAAQFNAL